MNLFDEPELEEGAAEPSHDELVEAPWKQEQHPKKEYRPYAGVGSRSTPDEILEDMATISLGLGNKGWTLRSGGAKGADAAFDWGAGLSSGRREIYLPVPNWRGRSGPHYHTPPKLAFAAARKAWAPYAERTGVSPWKALKPFTKKLMARNVCQICGPKLDRPVEFVVLWTPDGACKGENTTPDTGGTGMAIRIASKMEAEMDEDIPVFNLQRDRHRRKVMSRFSSPPQ